MAKKLKAIIKLMRLHSPWGALLLILPCWWGLAAGGSRDVSVYGLFALGGLLMRPFGCIVNDLWDRNIDKQIRRTASRPLASGAVSVGEAATLAAVLLVAALAVLLSLPPILFGWAVGVLPLVALYPLAKRFFPLPQLVLGLTFNWGVWMGWVAAADQPAAATGWLYLAAVCWTVFYDGIYSLQDVKGDTELGLRSFAIYFAAWPKTALAVFAAAALLFFAAAGITQGAGQWGVGQGGTGQWGIMFNSARSAVFWSITAIMAIMFCYRLAVLTASSAASAHRGFRGSVWIGALGVVAWLG